MSSGLKCLDNSHLLPSAHAGPHSVRVIRRSSIQTANGEMQAQATGMRPHCELDLNPRSLGKGLSFQSNMHVYG